MKRKFRGRYVQVQWAVSMHRMPVIVGMAVLVVVSVVDDVQIATRYVTAHLGIDGLFVIY